MKLLVPPVDDCGHIYQAMYIIINEEFDAGSRIYQQSATKRPAVVNSEQEFRTNTTRIVITFVNPEILQANWETDFWLA